MTRSSRSTASTSESSIRTRWASPSSTTTSGISSGFSRTVLDPAIAQELGDRGGHESDLLSRAGPTTCGTHVISWCRPIANGWTRRDRASAAFRLRANRSIPRRAASTDQTARQESKNWMETQDFEVLRNEQEFPRSWVVHKARAIKPFEGLSREPRAEGHARDPVRPRICSGMTQD